MNQFQAFLSLILISLLFIHATTTPPTHKELDDEMRGYVKYVAKKLEFDPDFFATHVTPTGTLANINYFDNGWSAFYLINFDREFVERQPTNIKKAMAAHEVGHTYYPCSVLSYRHRYGYSTYLEKENCADVVSAVMYKYEWTLAALKAVRRERPESIDIDRRIRLLEMQLGGILEREDEDLTYWYE